MRKIAAVAAAFALLALALAGCSMIEVDKAMDDAEAVAIVNGEVVTKAQARGVYYSYMSQLYDFYVAYGLDPAGIKEMTLDALIEERLLSQKAAELGLDAFDEAEEAELLSEAEALFEDYVTEYAPEYGKGETDEEIRESTAKALEGAGVTAEALAGELRRDRVRARLTEEVVKDVEISEEELSEAYEQALIDDAETYKDHYAFETAMNKEDNIVSWIPEGYRLTRHILFPFGEAEREALDRLANEIADLEDRIDELEYSLEFEEAGEEAGEAEEGEDTGDEAPPAEDGDEAIFAEIERLRGAIAAAEGEILAIEDAFLVSLAETLEAIGERIEGGEDFGALIEEFGGDPQMAIEPARSRGVYVCAESAAYENGYAPAAMAILNIGEVSAPTVTKAGVYLIKYEADAASGAVGLDAIREGMLAELLEAKKSKTYSDAKQAWLDGSDIQRFPDRVTLE